MQLHTTEDVAALREGIEADLAQLASPLTERLRRVDDLIEDRLKDLDALRETRLAIVHALRPIIGSEAIPTEPGRKGKPGPKTGTAKQNGAGQWSTTRVADETIEKVLAFVRERYAGGKHFTGALVYRDWPQDDDPLGENSIRASLHKLREREQIRFAKRGRGGSAILQVVE